MRFRSFVSRTSAWWRAKTGLLLSVLLLYLAVFEVPAHQGLWLLLLSLIAITGIGTIGHIINDWTDIDEDRKAGKHNTLSAVTPAVRSLLLVLAAAIGYSPWLLGFSGNAIIVFLLVLEVLLFSAYSLSPARLKRFPMMAIVLDALYAYVNPAFFLLLSFEATVGAEVGTRAYVGLFIWCLFIGLRHILTHHSDDLENDRKSGNPNLALRYSRYAILQFIRSLIVPIEIIGFLLFLMVLSSENLWLSMLLVSSFLLVIIYSRSDRFPYLQIHLGELHLDRFYKQGLSLLLLIILALQDSRYATALLVYLVLLTDFLSHPVLPAFLNRLKAISVRIAKFPVQQASLMFNWSLYYFRKWVLRWPEQRNWGEHYQKHLRDEHLKQQGTVAVFNRNYSKYSETFVQQQLRSLDYRVKYYYGTDMPIMEQEHGHLVSSEPYFRTFKYALLRLLNRDVTKYEERLIANDLVNKDVRLIIAHFGQMGTKLTTVSKQTGIPMMVIFHGYDAWNKGEIESYRDDYLELFQVASCVVGVSRDICQQLEKLGCSKEKIVHLPAQMDARFFAAEAHQGGNGNRFLSVGRFSKTKAPFILIQAFAKVLAAVPDAKLTMIGTDDGEHLFESCQMLARSLGVQESIEFKGALPADEVFTEMQNADVFVQHSVTTPLSGDKEGTPVGVMEAMALGLPVVATRHAGIAELIESGESGMLVSEYDADEMAQQMLRLSGNSHERLRLGSNARDRIINDPWIAENAKRLEALIEQYKLK